jgi:aminopeptidase N
MEHQSAIAYGNQYQNGYLGNDLSGTGWGLKWDFIIVHESGHEWFGNSITTKDLADMWVHEGFTNYSETLYTEWLDGKQAGNEYNYGSRKNISNDKTVIGIYGVNEEGSGDMYAKGSSLIHIIRNAINDDVKFRNIMRGLNQKYYHQNVTTQDVENYISKESGINFSRVFDQYLRTIQIPVLEYYPTKKHKEFKYRWTNTIKGFDLSPIIEVGGKKIKISPTHKWKTLKTNMSDSSATIFTLLEKNYYVTIKKVAP